MSWPCGWRLPAGVGLAAFLFYLYHLAPGMQWGDSARLGRVAYEGVSDFVTGGGHGLHTAIGWCFGRLPFPHPWTQNLMVACFGSAALAVFVRVLSSLGCSPLSSIGAAAALAVSHTLWLVSVMNESYALLALTFVLYLGSCLRVLARPSLAGMCASSCLALLGVANHQLFFVLGGAGMAAMAALLGGPDRWRWIGVHAALAAVALLSLLACAGMDQGPARFGQTLRYHAGHYLSLWSLGTALLAYPKYLALQFPSPFLILGAWGAWAWIRRGGRPAVLLGVLFAASVLFASSYGYGRRAFLYLPGYILFAAAAGHGLEMLAGRTRSGALAAAALSVVLPQVVYAGLSWAASSGRLAAVTDRKLPHLDADRYYFWPGKRGEDGAWRFVEELRRAAGVGGVIVADYKVVSPLKYDFALRGSGGIDLVQTDDFSDAAPSEIRRSLGRRLDLELGAGRRVVLADRGSVRFRQAGGRFYDAFPWLSEAYRLSAAENCFLLAKR